MYTTQVIRAERKDPIRPGKRLRCKVVVSAAFTSIPGLHSPLAKGEHEVIIHEADLPLLMAKVETRPELIEQARILNEEERIKYVMEKTRRPVDQVRATLNLPREQWDDITVKAEGTFAGSPEREFFQLTGAERRGINPLVSAKVIEELEGEISNEVKMAAQVAEHIRGPGMGGSSDELAAMRAEIDDLRAELNRRKGGRPRKLSSSHEGDDNNSGE